MHDFDVGNVFRGVEEAEQRGHRPTRLLLGIEETESLLSDANFNTSRISPPPRNTQKIGTVVGIDVERLPKESSRFMVAKEGENVYYYII